MNTKSLKAKIAVKLFVLLAAGFLLIDFFILSANQRRFIEARQSESWLLSLFVARSLEYNSRNLLSIAPSATEWMGNVFESAGIHATLIMDHRGRLIYVDSPDSELKSWLVLFATHGIKAGSETTDYYGSTWGVFRPARRYLAISSPITGIDGNVQASVSSVFDLAQFYTAQRRHQVRLVLAALFFILLLTFAGAKVIGRSITRPLQALADEVDSHSADGGMKTFVSGQSDEFAPLVDAFNRLLSRIQEKKKSVAAPQADPARSVETVKTSSEEKIKVACGGCGKTYCIAEAKLGDRLSVTISCPSCSHKIKVVRKTAPGADQKRVDASVSQANYASTGVSLATSEDGEKLRQKILSNTNFLPPMPQVVSKARHVFASQKSSFTDVSEVLETDQAIASRVLKMANSAYYGMQGQVSSIHQASVLLGMQTLGELITVAGSAQLLEKKLNGYDFSSSLLWRHSLAVANSAETIAEKVAPDIKDDAFFAGLIHDAGKLLLDSYLLEQKEAVANFLAYREKTFLAAERQLLGLDHAQVGYDLCQQWRIPEDQALAIRYHHNPVESEGNTLAYILHLSDWIAMAAGFGADFQALMHQMDSQAMDVLGLTKEDTDGIVEKVKEFVTSVSKDMQAGDRRRPGPEFSGPS